MKYSSANLVDGIFTLSGSFTRSFPVIYRALTRDTRIQLKVNCDHLFPNIKRYQHHRKAKIQIHGRIGRVVRCSSSEFYRISPMGLVLKDSSLKVRSIYGTRYDALWDELEQIWFTMQEIDCNYPSELYVDKLTDIKTPENKSEDSYEIRSQILDTSKDRHHLPDNESQINQGNATTKLTTAVSKLANQILQTWADGHYFIELFTPKPARSLIFYTNINVTISMKNRRAGYMTADEYPLLIMHRVMSSIYSIYAIVFLIWCILLWQKHKVNFFIVSAEVISCLQRTAILALFTMITLGYGIINSHLGPTKLKLFAMSILYFIIYIIEGLLRLTTELLDLWFIKFSVYALLWAMTSKFLYSILKNCIIRIRELRSINNTFKLNIYRYFRNTFILAMITNASMNVWLITRLFITSCIADVERSWVDPTFPDMPYSLILIVVMFLFQSSENLLDNSGEDEQIWYN
ncbi:unnamed protein product [Rotaria socialis]|uniref:GOST seven transmembrane domain-containing protein n=1 Tax=Rotaria socialis TaxID=392032 RepID=A0A818CLS8_9BILA|nr:unnamed protein product [Rotaria socialis]